MSHEHTTPLRFSLDEGFDVAEDTGTPVSTDYDVPFRFTGRLKAVTVDIRPQDKVTQVEEETANRQLAHYLMLRD